MQNRRHPYDAGIGPVIPKRAESTMKTKERRKRLRLYGKRRPRMPKPGLAKRDKGFSLRLINEADSRFAVVKQMRQRLKQLLDDCGTETLAEEWLAARAVFMLGYLESLEIEAYEGKTINWASYCQACNALNGLLTKLGAFATIRKKKTVTLEDYVNGKGAAKERKRR